MQVTDTMTEPMANIKTTLSLLLFLSFIALGCSNNEDEPELSLADFPFEDIMTNSIPYMIVMVEEHDGELDSYLLLHTRQDNPGVSLEIDGNRVQMESYNVPGSYYADLDLMPGQTFSYELTLNTRKHEGSLDVPSMVHGSFPAEFNLSEDYDYSWTVSSDPDGFLTFLDIDHDEEDVGRRVLLNGVQREYSFSSEIYSSLSEEDIRIIYVDLIAMNFDIPNDMVIISGFNTFANYRFESPVASETEAVTGTKEHHRRLHDPQTSESRPVGNLLRRRD